MLGAWGDRSRAGILIFALHNHVVFVGFLREIGRKAAKSRTNLNDLHTLRQMTRAARVFTDRLRKTLRPTFQLSNLVG